MNPKFTPRILSVAIAVLTGAAHAQAPAGKSAALEETLIIGSAQRAEEMPGSAYMVPSVELEKFQYSDINRIIRQVPGVYVREEEGYGLRPNIGIRGSGSERSGKISLMEDGILVAPAPYSNPEAYYFPTAGRMSAVEVLKGPETLKHGPFTVGGAVNLVSTPIPDKAGGRAVVELGENNEQRLHVHYGDSAETWGWLVETYQHDAEGFQSVDRSSRDAGFDKEDYVAKLRLNTPSNAALHQQLDIKLQYATETSNASYLGLTDADFKRDENRRYGLSALDQMDNEHAGASVRYRLSFSDDLSLSATYYYNDFKRDWFKVDRIDGINPLNLINDINTGAGAYPDAQGWLDGSLDVDNIAVKHNNREYESSGLQLALDARFETAGWQHDLEVGIRHHEDEMNRYQPTEVYDQRNGSLVFDSIRRPTGSDNRFEEGEALSLWAMDHLSWDRWRVTLGLRYEDIDTQQRQWSDADRLTAPSRRDNSVDALLGSLGVTYQLSDQWQLLAGVHEGFAPPGGASADGVEAEESLNTELGARFRQDAFSAELIAFHSDYTNTVQNCSVANPCTGGRDFGTESLGEARVKGVEAALGYTYALQGGYSVPVRFSYTYTDGEITESSDTGSVLRGDNLPDVPENQWSAQVGLVHDSGWDAYLNASYLDALCMDTTCARDGVDDRFLETDDLLVFDLSASYPLNERVRLYTRIDNLLDDQEIVARSPLGARPNKPRTAYLGLRIDL